MSELINNLVANLIFIFERLNWLSVVDILLVTAVFFGILQFLRGTQAFVLLRGILLLIALVGVLTMLEVLPAFSWLVRTTLPALLFSIPVIFAPEIRHALERLGRAGVSQPDERTSAQMQDTIGSVVSAAVRLSDRQHGALIVLQRRDNLEEYVQTGVRLDARINAQLLLQIFYPNTPLHDGAVVISGRRLLAAACVMPLSASGVLAHSADRQMGLRHRAALGISEVSDAVAVVVSEETGAISVVHSGRMIRRLDADRLENILRAFFKPANRTGVLHSIGYYLTGSRGRGKEEFLMRTVLRWLTDHLGALLLAFVLALVVWVSAVITADPNEQHTSRSVDIQVIGQNPNLLLVQEIPRQARLTLEAPRSIWDKLNSDPTLIKTWIDLSGLDAGEHEIEVKSSVNASPVRSMQIDPERIHLTLEPLMKRTLPVQPVVTGGLPFGYQKGNPTIEPEQVTISGPQSQVNQVSLARVLLNISGATESINQRSSVEILDENGAPVPNVEISPAEVAVDLPIRLLGEFKNVAVKVVTKGQVADGYRLTSISVSPPTVTLFSDNPNLIEQIPGFVETLPVDLTNLSDDIEISTGLNLPENVTLVREPSVLVQVSVAAIEGSLTLTVPVEAIGLPPELQAVISPATVDIIVSGPLNYLDQLSPANFRVIVDLTDLPPGVYQRQVVVDLQPDAVRVQTTLPESVEVTIDLAPTPTPNGTAPPTGLPGITPQLTPTPTAQP